MRPTRDDESLALVRGVLVGLVLVAPLWIAVGVKIFG